MTLSARDPIWFAGAFICVLFAVLCGFISGSFAWDVLLADRPTAFFVSLLIGSNLAFGFWFFYIHSQTTSGGIEPPDRFWREVWFIFLVGLLARAVLFPSTPILEDDFYRYLWDGAVTANSLDPYSFAPDKFAYAPDVETLLDELDLEAEPVPAGYDQLADQGKQILLRVNNPNIATIYPPLAQLGFAMASWISPFQILGLKIVSLAAELLTFLLLTMALRSSRLGAYLLTLYWWHPLVLKEFANTVHMDVLLMPVLALAVLMVMRRKEFWVQITLGLAAAIKLWPLMLMPLVAGRNWRAIGYVIIGSVLALVLILPQLISLNEGAGLTRYSQDWQRNALAFPVVNWLVSLISSTPGMWLRLTIALSFVIVIVKIWWQQSGWQKKNGLIPQIGFIGSWPPSDKIIDTAVMTILMLCLLVPTGYPWYSLWLLPLLVIRPSWAAIMLTLTSGFYYLDFKIQLVTGNEFIVWLPALLSAGPVWLMLAYKYILTKKVSHVGA